MSSPGVFRTEQNFLNKTWNGQQKALGKFFDLKGENKLRTMMHIIKSVESKQSKKMDIPIIALDALNYVLQIDSSVCERSSGAKVIWSFAHARYAAIWGKKDIENGTTRTDVLRLQLYRLSKGLTQVLIFYI